VLRELDAETTAHDWLDRPCFPTADKRVLGRLHNSRRRRRYQLGSLGL
jgi:hypothetical protein